MENVATVILNWNSSADTANCVKSLNSAPNIVVVDNGSDNKELETLKNSLPKNIYLVVNDTNYGFAKGNNIGINFALKKFSPEFIMLLNSDTTASPDFLSPLLDIIRADNSIAAVQPKILKLNAPDIIDSAGQIPYKYGSVRDIGLNLPDGPTYQNTQEIFGACAAAVLLRVSALKNVGFFDEDLFCLFEDVDLSWRLRLAGYKIFYEPKSIIYHKRGISGTINKSNLTIRRFYGFRNCLITTLRYYPAKYIFLYTLVHLYRLFTAIFFKFRNNEKAPLFSLISKGLSDRKTINQNVNLRITQKNWII